MTRFGLTLLCILSSGVIYASSGNVKIHGTITHPLSDTISFSTYEGRLEYNPHEYKAKLDKGGNFSISFPVNETYDNVNITHGEQGSELFISPGDDLTMTLDGNDFDKSIHYSGKGAEVANFTASHVADIGMILQYGNKMQPLMSNAPDEFIEAAKKTLQPELDYLETHKTGLPASFVTFWKAHYKYMTYYFMVVYPYVHKNPSDHAADKNNYKVVTAIPIQFDDEYLNSSYYRTFVSNYFPAREDGLDSIESAVYDQNDSAQYYANKMLPPASAEFYSAYRLYLKIKSSSVTQVDSEYNKFKKAYPKSMYLPALEKRVITKRKFGIGQPAPDFAFTTADGKKTKLSNLKGKVVYMDFWASWCGPCMRELPHEKEVEKHFAGNNNIVFLNVSIDDDADAWKKSVDLHKIEGINVRDSGGWQGSIAKKYDIPSVPSYFIIDKSGKFVTDVEIRPSATDKLISILENSLK